MNNSPIKRLFRCFLALAVTGVVAGSPPALAQFAKPAPMGGQPVERIAAVVNDEIISMSDLEARMHLAFAASSLPDSPESRMRLAPQVLRALIDEKLQLQEAKRLNVRVADAEINERFGWLAGQNRMSREQMEESLRGRGVDLETLRQQLRASVAWAKVLQRAVRPSVSISEEEVDAVLQRIQANAGKPEFLVAEVFLAVDNPDRDEEIRRLAERLVEQIAQGASFSAVARQFSQSAGAAQGGDLGWIQPGQLADELDRALRELRPGQMSRPIRSLAGYHILLVRDVRTVQGANPAEVKLGLKQLYVPRAAGENNASLQARAERQRAELKDCAALDAKAQSLADGVSGDLGTVRLSELPRDIAQIVGALQVGQAGPPAFNEAGAVILMVCGRDAPKIALPAREDILNALANERMDMLARRLLRDLRNAAYVDVRV